VASPALPASADESAPLGGSAPSGGDAPLSGDARIVPM